MSAKESRLTRFYRMVEVSETGTCWYWQGAVDKDGYGKLPFLFPGRRAHRYAYSIAVGELVPGYTIDHRCRNLACVNPDHLDQVTNTENQRRRHRAPILTSRLGKAMVG